MAACTRHTLATTRSRRRGREVAAAPRAERWSAGGLLAGGRLVDAPLLAHVLRGEVPVGELPEGVHELAAIVAVVDVVRVLPDVARQQGARTVDERVVRVLGADD